MQTSMPCVFIKLDFHLIFSGIWRTSTVNNIFAKKSTAIGVLQENIEEVLKQENSPTKDVDGKLEELQK